MSEEKRKYRTQTISVDHSVILSEVALAMTKQSRQFTITKQDIQHYLIDLVASDKELYNQVYQALLAKKTK